MHERNVYISDAIIQEKAEDYQNCANSLLPEDQRTNLTFSNGWLHRFKIRNRFRCFRAYGEAADADEDEIDRELPGLCEKLSTY